jgi:serine/threonine-protein kinase
MDYVYCMRKFGLIATIVGFGTLGADLVLRWLTHFNSWLWLPGFLVLAMAAALYAWARAFPAPPVVPAPEASPAGGTATSRLLDNFEQRFVELKGRKASAAVVGDLYALGTQLELCDRSVQAIAVYRHLARIDNNYLDVSSRLKRLMDADRAKSAPPTGHVPAAAPTPGRARASEPGPASASAPGLEFASPPGLASGPGRAVASAPGRAIASAPGSTYASAPDPPAAPRAPASVSPPASAGGAADAAAHGPPPQSLGRYLLEREIGHGAMGTVYLGRDTAINRQVAIKAIPLASEFSDAELDDARARFFREAETAGRLNHPNIVTIYDVGEERGLAYIAMEYLRGRHLSDYAAAKNLLEPRKVLDLIARTASALGFAHKQQVVHRDIKPANLMYDPGSDVLKITDFGIARLTGAGSTRTGIVLGTPSFMSPEQLEGRTVTGQSDLFSLGVSLFQLLTGQLPFTADSMTGLMQQIAESPHPPLRAYRPDLAIYVEKVIDRALAKSPDARFDSGAQMAAALEDCRLRMPSGSP